MSVEKSPHFQFGVAKAQSELVKRDPCYLLSLLHCRKAPIIWQYKLLQQTHELPETLS